jgi:uncharacterized membrane protein
MQATLAIHIFAGALALVFGYVALFASKGSRLHRRSGRLFVYAMLTMALGGFVVAAGRSVAPAVNIPAALLTAYLVVTSLTTIRPSKGGSRALQICALLVAPGVGFSSLAFAFEAVTNGGARQGMPAFPFFLFGIIALIASAGDLRSLRSGAPQGASRIARHLWRMCFALLIAALSFFIGQADEFPPALRIMPLLALPMLVVLGALFYWLWRVRFRRSWAPAGG